MVLELGPEEKLARQGEAQNGGKGQGGGRTLGQSGLRS